MVNNMKDKILEWVNFFVGVVFVLLIYFFRNNIFNVLAVASIGASIYGLIYSAPFETAQALDSAVWRCVSYLYGINLPLYNKTAV